MHKTPLLIEQHIHGAFGIDFNTVTSIDEVLYLTEKLQEHGIGRYFPTLVTDSIQNVKKQTSIIKAASKLTKNILGIHLEGIFINLIKKGIHNSEHFLDLTKENFKLIEDDFIKIVTLAPELDKGLVDYLIQKGIKVQAGHCIGGNLEKINGVTHLFNAMSGIEHRKEGTALSALINDEIYTEIIADGIHISDATLKLILKSKPTNKILLISDALPITYSSLKETTFADSKIYYDGHKATSATGTIAGSTILLDKIIKRLFKMGVMNPIFIKNVYEYHAIEPQGEITWDDEWNIIEIKN